MVELEECAGEAGGGGHGLLLPLFPPPLLLVVGFAGAAARGGRGAEMGEGKAPMAVAEAVLRRPPPPEPLFHIRFQLRVY